MSPTRLHLMHHSTRCLRALLVATVLLLAPDALSVSGASIGSADPVYLLNAMYSPDPHGTALAQAMWLGIDAALYHANYSAFGGRPIQIVLPRADVNQSDILAVVEAALADFPSLLSVIGPFTDPLLLDVLGSSTIRDTSLVFVAPLTESSAVRTWSENVYFTRAEPQLQVLTLVRYIANTLRVRRTAFMYLSGIGYGEPEYAKFALLMAKLSLDPAVVYSAPYSVTGAGMDAAAFDAMADTHPQVVIVWGVPGLQTNAFLQAVLTDPRTSSAYIITSFALQQDVFQVYYDLAMAGTITPVAGQVLTSATVLPVTEPGTQHIPMFVEQMDQYMAGTGNVDASLWAAEAAAVARYGSAASASGSSHAEAFLRKHPSAAQMLLTGWIAGTLMMQTLMQPSYITSAAAYQAGLFEQHRYIVGGDYVLGDYGGPCDAVAQFQTAVCYCNQGGHAAFMQVLSNASWTTIAGSGVNYSQSDCYSTNTYLSAPLNYVTLMFEEYPQLVQIVADLGRSASAFLKYIRYTARPIKQDVLKVTDATAQGMLNARLNDHTTTFMMSTVAANLDVSGYLVPSPVFARPHLVQLQQNYVYLMPTLEQQTYLLYQNLAVVQGVASVRSTVRVVLHGYEGGEVANMTAMLRESAATFDYDDPEVVCVLYNGSIYGSLAAGAINYVLGMTAADVLAVANFLSSDAKAVVVVPFDDLMLQYTVVVAAFASLLPSVQARLVSFSSLPLWTDTSAAAQAQFPILAKFFGALPDAADHTPSKLLGILMAGFVLNLASGVDGVNASQLVSNIYLNGVLSVYGVALGTYSWGCTVATTGQHCVYQNYGAQDISMLSVQRMLNPSVPALTTRMTPSMVYTPRTTRGLTAAQRSGAIAGSVLGGVLLSALVALMVFLCSRSGRNNASAPRDDDDPVTLIFTDIESSTAMWAAVPQEMSDAIAAHHRVIRQLIRKHGCYEVKTIGDSFMIACKDAYSAVKLACDIQTRLLAHNWGTDAMDVNYHAFELAKADSVEGYVPPTARLSEEEYAALWRGLRVRVGVHTGLSDIRYDDVTKGYDYYGDTSNMAARTEAVANGGQVVVTETTWWALSSEERHTVEHTELGSQGLRGVPFAVEMYQLDAVPGRKHAALRTEIDAILPDDGADETGSSDAESLLSLPATMSGTAAAVAVAIGGCFAPYPVAQRVRELQPLLSKWGVGAPPRPPQVSEEAYCQALMNRLAVRVASVTEMAQGTTGAAIGRAKVPSVTDTMPGNPLKRPVQGLSAQPRDFAAAEVPEVPAQHLPPLRGPPTSGAPPRAPAPQTGFPPVHGVARSGLYSSLSSDLVTPLDFTYGPASRGPASRAGSVMEEVLVRLPSGSGLRRRLSRSDVWDMPPEHA